MSNFKVYPCLDSFSKVKKNRKKLLKKYHKTLQKNMLPADALMHYQHNRKAIWYNVPEQMLIDFDESGVYFGLDPNGSGDFIGKSQQDDGHVLIVGSPGCHKTAGVILPTLLTWRGPFAAVDVKGDITEFCRRHRETIACPTKIIDFSGDEITAHFDPFLKLRQGGEDELISNARELALAIIPTPHDVREPFWVQGAQNILTAIILYAVGKGLDFNTTVEMVLTTPAEEIQKGIQGSENSLAQAFITQYPVRQPSQSEDKTLTGSFVELTNHLRDFFHSSVQKVFADADDVIDLNRDLNSCRLIIRIPEAKLNQLGGAARLILQQLLSTLTNRPEKYSPEGRFQPPFVLLWDEMPRLGKMEELTQAFSTLRSRGVTICAVIQSFSQLDHIYGPSVRRSLVDCCPYIVIGTVQDVETQKYCSELIGSAPVWMPGVSENYHPGRNEFTFGRGLNLCREPILYPEDFAVQPDFIVSTPFGKFRIEKNSLIECPNLLLQDGYSRGSKLLKKGDAYEF